MYIYLLSCISLNPLWGVERVSFEWGPGSPATLRLDRGPFVPRPSDTQNSGPNNCIITREVYQAQFE